MLQLRLFVPPPASVSAHWHSEADKSGIALGPSTYETTNAAATQDTKAATQTDLELGDRAALVWADAPAGTHTITAAWKVVGGQGFVDVLNDGTSAALTTSPGTVADLASNTYTTQVFDVIVPSTMSVRFEFRSGTRGFGVSGSQILVDSLTIGEVETPDPVPVDLAGTSAVGTVTPQAGAIAAGRSLAGTPVAGLVTPGSGAITVGRSLAGTSTVGTITPQPGAITVGQSLAGEAAAGEVVPQDGQVTAESAGPDPVPVNVAGETVAGLIVTFAGQVDSSSSPPITDWSLSDLTFRVTIPPPFAVDDLPSFAVLSLPRFSMAVAADRILLGYRRTLDVTFSEALPANSEVAVHLVQGKLEAAGVGAARLLEVTEEEEDGSQVLVADDRLTAKIHLSVAGLATAGVGPRYLLVLHRENGTTNDWILAHQPYPLQIVAPTAA